MRSFSRPFIALALVFAVILQGRRRDRSPFSDIDAELNKDAVPTLGCFQKERCYVALPITRTSNTSSPTSSKTNWLKCNRTKYSSPLANPVAL